ncbi:hypothetical protein ACQP2T_40270 [Nonomuraea sp. CA-143628]|uniref:hypothetical protein n=1 Tax=Nonomuraea sp. CA-143628 TaxID=3239997 RepID=UPI003D9368CB
MLLGERERREAGGRSMAVLPGPQSLVVREPLAKGSSGLAAPPMDQARARPIDLLDRTPGAGVRHPAGSPSIA